MQTVYAQKITAFKLFKKYWEKFWGGEGCHGKLGTLGKRSGE